MSTGEVYKQIQRLLVDVGKNDPTTISYIRTKLMLKGIDPDKFGPNTEDPPQALMLVNKFYRTLAGGG
jgi:hypothetical protein